MRKRLSYPLYLGLLFGGISACQGSDDPTPGQVIRAETEAQASDCPNGGVDINWGVDTNGDG